MLDQLLFMFNQHPKPNNIKFTIIYNKEKHKVLMFETKYKRYLNFCRME